MSKLSVKYKVLSYDPETNSMVIRWAKEGEEYKTEAYNFELHNQGARDFEHLKCRIAATAMGEIKRETAKNKEVKDPGTREQYQSMVGQEFTYTDEEIWLGEHPDQIGVDARAKALMAVEDQYPIANTQSVEKILSMTFQNVYVEPVYRLSDKNLIGVRSQRMGTQTPEMASTSFRSLIRLTEVCRKYGVPNLGEYMVNKKSGNIEKWQDFWKEHGYEQCGDVYQTQQVDAITADSYEVIEYDCAYVYIPWTPEMAAARKIQIIEQERAEVEFVEYEGHAYDADQWSLNNMIAAITAMDAGMVNIGWRDRSNEVIDLNQDDLQAIVKSIVTERNEAYRKSWERKAHVNIAINSSQSDDAKFKAITDA